MFLVSGIVVAATTIGSSLSTDGNLTVLGNAGIGTSTLSARFSVTGDSTGATRGFVFADANDIERFAILNNGTVGVGTSTPHALFGLGTAVASGGVYMTNAGNVGIGVSSPESSFHVKDALGVISERQGGGGSLTLVNSSSTPSVAARIGNVFFSTRTAPSSFFHYGMISTTYAAASQGNLVFYAANGSSAENNEVARITNNAFVGIATSSPSGRLSVRGAGTGTGFLAYMEDSAGTARFVIRDNGNVGIGTTTLSSVLGVAGDTAISRADADTALSVLNTNSVGGSSYHYPKITITNYRGNNTATFQDAHPRLIMANANGSQSSPTAVNTNNILGIVSGKGYDSTTFLETTRMTFQAEGPFTAGNGLTSIKFYNDPGGNPYLNASLRMIITSAGNVGIGTPAPSALFHISSTTPTLDLFRLTAGSANVLINSSGNLGIGTTTPSTLLSVHGNGLVSGSLCRRHPDCYQYCSSCYQRRECGNRRNLYPASLLSVLQSANTKAGGLTLAATDGDTRGVYMNTSGVLNFEGGDGGTINIASLNAAGAWTNASDIRYKESITDIPYGLTDIMKLHPVHYQMKGTHLKQIGFIAQEMKPLIPEVVDGEEGSLGISYGNLTAATVKAIQELNNKIDKSWIINDQGQLVVKEIKTEKLEVGSSAKPEGITIYDETTGEAMCAKSRNKVLTLVEGGCAP